MKQPYVISIAGLGTVGVGVLKILQEHSELIQQRAGREIVVHSVSSRDKNKDRGVDLSEYNWADNPQDLVESPSDAIVELIGGSEGIALSLAQTSLQQGKAFVTANKALLAIHGNKLSELSDQHNSPLKYESAVAGGIPIIKSIREGLSGNKISNVYGILNGTCNYILSEMQKTGTDFDEVLSEAQAIGYAEADPSFDIDGVDAAHKLCILSALAFGVKPNFDSIALEGIRNITLSDISFADELGYKIKLLGSAKRLNGKIIQIVAPCLVDKRIPMAAVDGSFNAVFVDGDYVDQTLSVGRGAGEGPTASAVVADIIDLARGFDVPVFGCPHKKLEDAKWANPGELRSRFYMHMVANDKPGVIADISGVLRDYDISMESILQRGRNPDNPVSVVMTTYETTQEQMNNAANKIGAFDSVKDNPLVMRIEEVA